VTDVPAPGSRLACVLRSPFSFGLIGDSTPFQQGDGEVICVLCEGRCYVPFQQLECAQCGGRGRVHGFFSSSECMACDRKGYLPVLAMATKIPLASHGPASSASSSDEEAAVHMPEGSSGETTFDEDSEPEHVLPPRPLVPPVARAGTLSSCVANRCPSRRLLLPLLGLALVLLFAFLHHGLGPVYLSG
jgi:hypothetical protein